MTKAFSDGTNNVLGDVLLQYLVMKGNYFVYQIF